MSIFDHAPEFIDLDNRKHRYKQTTSKESLTEKLLVQLPENLIKGKTVLDLGSCLGAAGHHALSYGASFYTGVEIQDYYYKTSKQLLKQRYSDNAFEIIQQDIEQFLDIAISENKKYDYVLAAGVIYGFVDIVGILKKIAKVSRQFIMIDTLNVHITTTDEKSGIIIINEQGMVKGKSPEKYEMYFGTGSKIDLRALDMVMATVGCQRDGDIIYPKLFKETIDAYNTPDPVYFKDWLGVDFNGPIRYMVRYQHTNANTETVQEVIKKDNNLVTSQWTFDTSVAERFQHEAETNIPSYHLVIDKCLQFANKHLQKTDKVIDVGSALGYTLNKFINAGFTNVMGVDNSSAMIEKSMHKSVVVCDDKLPDNKYKLVIMNWTLHFVVDKETYLRNIYNSLDDGYLILTEKCSQSLILKDLYYDFKRSKGVSEEYIKQKEKNLIGVMHSVPVDWYLKTLREIGFKVDIIHGDLGFITFLCSTNQN